jgi:hypothetical protein
LKKAVTVLAGACMLALLTSAEFAQGSGRNPVTGFSHHQDLTAMSNSYQAQVRLVASPGSYPPHLHDLTALKDYMLPLAHPTVAAERGLDSPSRGFNWDDAGIGAATAIVLITLIGSSTLLLRQRSQRRHDRVDIPFEGSTLG